MPLKIESVNKRKEIAYIGDAFVEVDVLTTVELPKVSRGHFPHYENGRGLKLKVSSLEKLGLSQSEILDAIREVA